MTENAVHHLVRALQGDIYGLALRMLWNRDDAEDATQEILVRIVTRLSQFDFRSRLETWVYRVATNYLLDVKKSAVEHLNLSFSRFAEDLAEGLSAEGPADGERSLLTEEVKIGCTLAMLQCLDRPHRLAYVLGEVLELPASEAADAMAVEAATFRKRLQRARERIELFTRKHCGLVSDSAACQCNRRVPAAVQLGRARANDPQFARTACSFEEARTIGPARRAGPAGTRAASGEPSEGFHRRLCTSRPLRARAPRLDASAGFSGGASSPGGSLGSVRRDSLLHPSLGLQVAVTSAHAIAGGRYMQRALATLGL